MSYVTSLDEDVVPSGQGPLAQIVISSAALGLSATVGANSTAAGSVIRMEGYTGLAVGVTLSQTGRISLQRYLDAAGTVAQGAAVSVPLAAAVAGVLNFMSDGLPFQSVVVSVTNTSGSTADITGLSAFAQAGGEMAPPAAITTLSAVIASGQSVSGEVALSGGTLAGISMPAAWDAAVLSFQVSADGGTTYQDMHDMAGEITATATASIFMVADRAVWRGVDRLKVRSGTSASPVNQTASRTVSLIVRPVA